MSLISPRFRFEPELQEVSDRRRILKVGARGRHVHLVQMALLDAGFAMPRSTTSNDYSPDGIYGPETQEVVGKYQRATAGLKVDGQVGAETLGALDSRYARFSHRFSLHFRSLSLSDVPFALMMSGLERVYGQYGIQAQFASGESLGLSEADQNRFNIVRQDCAWQLDSGEFADLEQLGDRIPSGDIGVFIVNQFQQINVLGCGGHAATRPACAVTHNCSRWDVSHEVCHVLLTPAFVPVHTASRQNLMYAYSSNGPTPLTLTEKQLAQIRLSPLCRAA
jgi:hypothetical protein